MFVRALIFGTLLFSSSAFANDDDCNIGPVQKIVGGTPWQMYACHEDKQLMFVSSPGSPAGDEIFMLFWDKDHWVVMDLGTGNLRAVNAVRQELRALTDDQITALIAEAKVH